MRIRLAGKSDVRAIAKLDSQVFPQTPFEQSLKAFRSAFANRVPSACFVAEDRGKLVGALVTEKKTGFTARAAYIKSFFVRKDWREKGVGTRLMDACFAALKKKKLASVSLTVYPNNRTALRVYEKRGFKLSRLVYAKKL